MSAKVSALVWKGYPTGGSELLVLLALTDWCDDQGGRLYPSMRAIASKARLSESQARRVVHDLVRDEFLIVIGNDTGGAPGSTRNYQINLDKLRACADDTPTPSTHARGIHEQRACMDAREGLHGCAETPSTHDTQYVSEPLVDVRGAGSPIQIASKKSSITLKTFLEHCQAKGEKPIPEHDPVWAYAEKVGITDEMIAVAWTEFKGYWTIGQKRHKDWRGTFLNAVRQNRARLWFLKDGEPAQWTTVGEQARRAAA